MPTICSLFPIQLVTFSLSSLPTVFSQYFAWIALGDVDLHLSLILGRRANVVENETR
jgi:hypothetical protein